MALYASSRSEFVDRLREANFSQQYIKYLIDSTTFIATYKPMPAVQRPRNHKLWAVLPYHPLWEKDGKIAKVIKRHFQDEHLKILLKLSFESSEVPFECGVSWAMSELTAHGASHVCWRK